MRRLAPLVAVLGVAVLVGPVHADGPADDSRKAAQQLGFSGRVRLSWVDDDGTHTRVVDVEADDGVIVVAGPTTIMARSGARLVQRPGQGWDLVWPAELGAPSLPSVARKYVLARHDGPKVAGRATVVVDVSRAGAVQERLFVDTATGLILRREELDARGRARRVVTFERLSVTRPSLSSAVRSAAGYRRASLVTARSKPPFRAPGRLAGDYRRVGTYTRAHTAYALYSDGVYALSIFEQRGRLESDDVPTGGRRVEVGGHRGWHYSWPGGEVVLWQAGDAVFTAVGEAPVTDVVTAARSIPTPISPSPFDKLRRACRGMLQAFS